jgi:hypothetical protein
MVKRKYKNKTNKTNKKYNRKRKYTKKRKIGGMDNNPECSICCKKTNDKMLIPNACLMKYGKYKAHKICSECWWSKFAQEGVNHKCPGCQTGKPLNKDPYANQKNTVIDLTEDD